MKVLVSGVATVLVGLGLAVAAAGTAHAAYPGQDGRLAYVTGGDVYTADVADPTRVTDYTRLTTSGQNAGPRWSPNGARIAYEHAGQVWVMNADGTGQHRVSPLTGAGIPAWSPDGKYLAVAADEKPASTSESRLYRINLANGATALYRTDATELGPVGIFPKASPVAWSGDGLKIVAESDSCGNYSNYSNCTGTITLPDPTSVQGTESLDHAYGGSDKPLPGRAFHPDWKPDSSAYLYSEVPCNDLFKCDATRLVLPGGRTISNARNGVYSPTGRQIAYEQPAGDLDGPLILVDSADGSGLGPYLIAAGDQPDWQPTH